MSLLDGISNVIKGNAGRINTISSIYAIGNAAIKLAGGRGISSSGYRPSQWGHTRKSADLVNIACNFGGFFADAVFGFSGELSTTITSHPVQSGGNISDHAYVNPMRVNVELGVSDAMAFYTSEKYTIDTLSEELKSKIKQNKVDNSIDTKVSAILSNDGSTSKSTMAVALLILVARAREPFSIYGTDGLHYENMLIEELSWDKDPTRKYSIKINLSCVEVLLANVEKEKTVSARGWTSYKSTKKGEVQGTETNKSIAAGWDPKGGTLDK